MDFVKKFAQEQLEKQMGGNQNQGNQQHNQGQGQNSGYGNQQSGGQGGFGDLINSFTGGQQQQQQHHQGGQQQNYGGQQNYEGQQNYGGQEERYGNQGENYGGQGQNYGGQQENYGGQGDYDGGRQSGGFGVTGGSQYNAPHGSGGASSLGGGAGGVPNINQNEALQAANQHAGNGNENASLFSSAFSFIQGMNKDDNDIDEDDVQQKHEKAYGQGQAGNMSASAIGSAAALQAIKQFTSGSSGAAGGSTNKGGNDMVSKIIGMALSEAAKLFDKSGGAATGTKEDAVTSAGQTVMKLLLKNQVSGMMGGGQSGGLGSLMSMASKFM